MDIAYNVEEHYVKILAQYDKNCRRKSILKTCGQTDPQRDTLTDNKGRLKLSDRKLIELGSLCV